MARHRSVLVVSRVPLEQCAAALWYRERGWRVLMAESAVRADQLLRGVRVDLVVHVRDEDAEQLDPDTLTVIQAERALRATLRRCLEKLQAMRDGLAATPDPEACRALDAEFSRYLALAARSRRRIRRLGARLLSQEDGSQATSRGVVSLL